MKKVLLIIFIVSSLVTQARESTSLLVYCKDGSFVTYVLSEEPKVSMLADSLLITTDGVSVSYPLSEMWKFSFDKSDELDCVNDVLVDELCYSYSSESIVFSGLPERSYVRVYAIDGRLLHSSRIDTESYRYSLSSLSSGVYVIEVNKKTFKISKK